MNEEQENIALMATHTAQMNGYGDIAIVTGRRPFLSWNDRCHRYRIVFSGSAEACREFKFDANQKRYERENKDWP